MLTRFAPLLLALIATPAIAKGPRHDATSPDGSLPAAERVEHRDEWAQYLRSQRQTQIERLATYSAAGAFPINPGPERFSHQLLDSDGTPCAMAYLVQQTDPRLIERTAKTDNALLMAEQQSGPFYDWILTSGLTREEVAIVQAPSDMYMGDLVWIGDPLLFTSLTEEQLRIQGHINATLTLLYADADPSIDLALSRLGEKIYELPPSNLASL